MSRMILAGLLSVVASLAQSSGTATLVGDVTDSTGAIVPNVKVTVRNLDNQFLHEGRTNQTGAYFIPNLQSGSYELTIESQGFKRYVQSPITLRINEQPRIDVQLQLGNVTESVQVAATQPLLETETAGNGQILDSELVTRLPVMQKFVHRVLLYMPGMTNINGQHAAGQRQRAIGYTLDGVNGKEPAVGQVGDYQRTMIASLDSIQEFKMWTTGTPAEFGHSGGGLLSTVFKSGANDFHGSVEDRYTNGKLIHRSFLEQLPRTGDFIYQEWGATASGRIKRDKTFFFAGFQQHYEKLNETFIGTVPSPQMYAGDFSFNGLGFPIYNPFSTRQENGAWVRDPFAGNQIPQALFDPVAKNLIAANPWRAQSDAGTITAAGPNNNLTTSAFGAYIFSRIDGKIDHQFNSNHRLNGRYSLVWHRSEERPVRELTEVVFGNVYIKPIDHHNVVVSDSYTFNPSTINEIRLGFNRRVFSATPQSFGADWAGRLGIPNVSPETFPEFRNSTGARFFGLGPDGRSSQVSEDFTLQENFTKIVGRHTLKAGYEMIHTRYNSLPAALPSGEYRMGGTEFPFRPNTGNAFASLLLGTVVQGIYSVNAATWLPRWNQHALYLQDSWRPIRNVSVELGLRWSYESPFHTKWGQQSQFDPTATDPLTGRQGAIVHGPGNLARRDFNNFQPRVGLAWTLAPRTVFRASFGAFAIDLMTNGVNQNFEEYLATANIQAVPGDPRHSFRLSQGPPSFSYPANADGSVPFQGSNFGGRNASWFDPNMRLPYVYNWSAGIQHQLSATWVMEVLYQASAGVGLLNAWDTNVVPLDISNNPTVLNQVFQQVQNFKPYPQFGRIDHYANYGHNTHHSGMLRFERRFSQGMTMNAFYQLGKTINNADDDGTVNSAVTFYNRSLEKARANYDIRHRFVGVFTYELPFGRGRRWGNRSGFTDWVFGNWDFALTQTFQSGPPTTVTFAGSPNRYLPGASRPNQIAPNDVAQPSGWEIGPDRFPLSAQNRYYSFDGFAYPTAFTPGTLGRNTFESPGLRWTQLSLSKQFRIRESMFFSIRWDVNNPSKEPQFPDPNGAFNLANRANFGTFSGNGRGSFSDIGTSRMHHIIVGRFQW